MAPFGLSPASESASSSLWAQPSKEWIIPAKPKPGRKPKETSTSAAVPKDEDEESYGSRRVQNRAAQRAFRERKQTQLAELQARLHSYEQGEIERNVALQNVAKKMKEENEELRKENQILREKISRLEQEHDELLGGKGRKRAYDDISVSSLDFPPADDSARKRVRIDTDKQEALPPALLSAFPLTSSSLVSSSPDSTAPAGTFSPEEHESHSRRSVFPTPYPINNLLSFAVVNEANDALDSHDPIEPYNCILCSPDAPCVCREVNVQQTSNNRSLHPLPPRNENHDEQQSVVSLDQPAPLTDPPASSTSAMDNLPAFPLSVPIRRRTGSSRANPIFSVAPIATTSSASASKCSGDPENCMACADDNFGKAFCQAIGHTLNSTLPCIDCPQGTNQTDNVLIGGCCGDISKCGSCGIAPTISSTTTRREPEIMSTDDAWRQLKSHPNVAFADLSLLAEVVARRSKCTGTRVVISPALTPDQSARPSRCQPTAASEDQSVLLTDPHEHFRRQQQRRQESPPQLVPQHVLIECGRRRMRKVDADGVREALRLLDQKFAHTR